CDRCRQVARLVWVLDAPVAFSGRHGAILLGSMRISFSCKGSRRYIYIGISRHMLDVAQSNRVNASVRASALRLRRELQGRRIVPATFRAEYERIHPESRDDWLDYLWDIDEIPADGPELPRGGVPYLPCAVGTVLEALQYAAVTSELPPESTCTKARACLSGRLDSRHPIHEGSLASGKPNTKLS